MRRMRFCFAAVVLLVSAQARADNLQDPVIIEPTAGAIPPRPAPGCPAVPALGGGVTVTSIMIKRAPRDIGPFAVPLNGYVTPSDPIPSYRPFLLKLDPGGSLVMDFIVDPSVGAVVSNLHTHGLIVRPRPVRVLHASAPCPAGDYIFIRSGPAEAGAGGGDPPHQAYRVDIPKTIPAALLGRYASPKPEGSAPYPAGLYWIHAHLHGVARPQVTEGMSGLISVGDDKDSIAPLPQSVKSATDVRYLALRDIQLLMACPPKKDGAGNVVKDAKANAVLDCGSAVPSLETIAARTPAEDARELYSSTNCDVSTVQGNSWCGGLLQIPNAAAPAGAAYAYWLFTVTGQLDPTITIPRGKNHLWRVANLSANVSYVLKLCDAAAAMTSCDDAAGRHAMTVVSVDGVQAGSRAEPGGATSLGVEVNQLLMMPGSRAAILVRNDGDSNVPAGKLQLRNASFNTGPGPVIAGVSMPTGDTWPDMVLAEINVEEPPPSAVLSLERREKSQAAIARIMQNLPTSSGREPASRPDCSFLPKDDAAHQYRRQIIFDEDNVNTIFRLGSQRVDQHNVIVEDNRNIVPAPFQHGGPGYTGDDFPPGLHACATLHRGEVWELINTTDELHNFHIHQGKFRLARKGDHGMPDSVTRTFQDPSNLLAGIVAEGSDPNPSVDMWHDTFPVPPKNGDVNGRVFIFIPFEADEQVGRFVFHCHILEHEDHGMMAAMEVVREKADKDELSTVNAMPETPAKMETHRH
jgi:FtsP/CotA-like multicopper oxidase with cupredoxin domain